jgi:hypothetical protein
MDIQIIVAIGVVCVVVAFFWVFDGSETHADLPLVHYPRPIYLQRYSQPLDLQNEHDKAHGDLYRPVTVQVGPSLSAQGRGEIENAAPDSAVGLFAHRLTFSPVSALSLS